MGWIGVIVALQIGFAGGPCTGKISELWWRYRNHSDFKALFLDTTPKKQKEKIRKKLFERKVAILKHEQDSESRLKIRRQIDGALVTTRGFQVLETSLKSARKKFRSERYEEVLLHLSDVQDPRLASRILILISNELEDADSHFLDTPKLDLILRVIENALNRIDFFVSHRYYPDESEPYECLMALKHIYIQLEKILVIDHSGFDFKPSSEDMIGIAFKRMTPFQQKLFQITERQSYRDLKDFLKRTPTEEFQKMTEYDFEELSRHMDKRGIITSVDLHLEVLRKMTFEVKAQVH